MLFFKKSFKSNFSIQKNNKLTLLFMQSNMKVCAKFDLHKRLLYVIFAIVFLLFGAFSAVFVDYIRLKRLTLNYEQLQAENQSIRSEASAMVARLEEIKNALSTVDTLSSQIREISKNESGKVIIKKGAKTIVNDKNNRIMLKPKPINNNGAINNKVNIDKNFKYAIGPLTKEDYDIANEKGIINNSVQPVVNLSAMEFKNIFEQLIDLASQSSIKTIELDKLLKETSNYYAKISTIPTLTPTSGEIVSVYGYRNSPFTGVSQMHWGIDIAAPMGTNVYAAASGIIRSAKYADDYGNYIEILHGNGFSTRYAHLSKILVTQNTKVTKGNLIAKVGSTGRSTGPHLHYEVEVGGKKVDPAKYLH